MWVYQSCVVLSKSNKRQAMHDCTPLLLQVRGGRCPSTLKGTFLLSYSFWSAKIPKFKFYYFDFWFTLFLVLLGIEQKSSQQFEKWRRMAQIEIEIGGKSSTFQTSLPYRPTSNNPLVTLLYQSPHSYILLLSPSLLLLFNTTQYIHSIFIFHKTYILCFFVCMYS